MCCKGCAIAGDSWCKGYTSLTNLLLRALAAEGAPIQNLRSVFSKFQRPSDLNHLSGISKQLKRIAPVGTELPASATVQAVHEALGPLSNLGSIVAPTTEGEESEV